MDHLSDTQTICLTIVALALISALSRRWRNSERPKLWVAQPGGHVFNLSGVCTRCGHTTKDDPKACQG